MNKHGINFYIQVGKKSIPEYSLDKDGETSTYVEGREGSEYEIHVQNNTGKRVEAVISVDGRSVIDGKLAGAESTGYLISPYGKVCIPGFLVDGSTAAKFTFGSPKASYAAQVSGGDTSNVGVIGVKVYTEKPTIRHEYVPPPRPDHPFDRSPPWPRRATWDYDTWDHLSASNSVQASNTQPRPRVVRGGSGLSPEIVEQGLGTTFGDATEFKTTSVNFERGYELTTLVLYYDNRKSLEKKGIVFERPKLIKDHQPNPFPASYAQPPEGWRERQKN